jgi:pimeloyl-ACP methyl ester carboxylesterase
MKQSLPLIRAVHWIGVLLAVLLLTGCARPTATPAPAAVPQQTSTPLPPTATPSPPTVTPLPPTATPEPTPAAAAGLPAEPQVVNFEATDGEPNEGVFFPAALDGAPVVVLMHWAGGSACDWQAIAPWLQGREVAWECPPAREGPWLDAGWFPALPEGASYNVFVFSFRGCGDQGCTAFNIEGWLAEAQGAMLAAASLDGVDPARTVAVGASIGSDGAADGCAYLNEQEGKLCRGAFSLSPGSYLTVPYDEAVTAIDADGHPAWCLYAPEDAKAVETCESASGEHYELLAYPNGGHGMVLIQPGLDTLEKMLDFLALTVG